MRKQVSSTKRAAPIVSDKVALVYDATGKIVHIHRVTTLKGGRARSDEEIVRAAREHGSRGHHSIPASGTEVLLGEAHELKPGHVHRVDVTTRSLKAEPRKP